MIAHHSITEAVTELLGTAGGWGVLWNVLSRGLRVMPKPAGNSYLMTWLYNIAQEVGANADKKV
jgi:hypothetical protein